MEEKKTRIVKGKQGYGYKYTELAQINEYLEANNMSYYQYVDRVDADDYIMTVPIIEGKEQPARRGVKIVDATLKGIQNPAQEQGSATTYARRYSLLMAFGLATEDDDAQSLSKPKQENKQPLKQDFTDMQIQEGQKQDINMAIEEGLVKLEGILEEFNVSSLEELNYKQAYQIEKVIDKRRVKNIANKKEVF